MSMPADQFRRFEHEGWERVAHKYDSVWSNSTRQFIAPLLDAAEVGPRLRVLDVGCGPGYVSAAATECGAHSIGLDFSAEMVAIARKMFPELEFREGDAQNLPFEPGTFDRVLASFSLLHLSDPEKAIAEACRVLKPGGKFGFTVWAPPEGNPYARMVDEAIAPHADMNVGLPVGPSHYLYRGQEQFREALKRAGFDPNSMIFRLHTIEWEVPSAGFVFEAERTAGVRTAGLLARQKPENLEKIRLALEKSVQRYAEGDRFLIPKAANVVAVSKPK